MRCEAQPACICCAILGPCRMRHRAACQKAGQQGLAAGLRQASASSPAAAALEGMGLAVSVPVHLSESGARPPCLTPERCSPLQTPTLPDLNWGLVSTLVTLLIFCFDDQHLGLCHTGCGEAGRRPGHRHLAPALLLGDVRLGPALWRARVCARGEEVAICSSSDATVGQHAPSWLPAQHRGCCHRAELDNLLSSCATRTAS